MSEMIRKIMKKKKIEEEPNLRCSINRELEDVELKRPCDALDHVIKLSFGVHFEWKCRGFRWEYNKVRKIGAFQRFPRLKLKKYILKLFSFILNTA